MRLRSDLWVAAYLRRCDGEGAPAVLRRRGAAEAGAVIVVVDLLDGRRALYGPAAQTAVVGRGIDRVFRRLHEAETIPPDQAEARIARELRFDPDLWLVEVEDRAGRHRLDLDEEG